MEVGRIKLQQQPYDNEKRELIISKELADYLWCSRRYSQTRQKHEPILRNGMIRSKREAILGAEDKAGIAELLEVIRTAEHSHTNL